MLYNFLLEFVEIFSFLNVFKYITFRTGLAVFTSLIIVLLIGGPFIEMVSIEKLPTVIYYIQLKSASFSSFKKLIKK